MLEVWTIVDVKPRPELPQGGKGTVVASNFSIPPGGASYLVQVHTGADETTVRELWLTEDDFDVSADQKPLTIW